MIKELKKQIDRALRQMRPAFRGVLTLLDTSGRLAVAQVKGLGDYPLTMQVFQHFGFSSAIPTGSELIVLPLLGRSGLSVIIASENGQYRFKGLVKGETAIYSAFGDYIHIKEGRIIEVKADTKLLVTAPEAEFTGNVKVAGNFECLGQIKDQKGTMQDIRDVYNGHGHDGAGAAQPKMNLP